LDSQQVEYFGLRYGIFAAERKALYVTEGIGQWIHLGQHWERAYGGFVERSRYFLTQYLTVTKRGIIDSARCRQTVEEYIARWLREYPDGL